MFLRAYRKMDLVPHIKVWLSTPDGQNIAGSGRCRLLQAIDETGSLSAAAEVLDISYRKAWGDLRSAEEHIGVKLVERTRGGSGGGRTVLTTAGTQLLEAYLAFKDDVERYTADSYERNIKGIFDDRD